MPSPTQEIDHAVSSATNAGARSGRVLTCGEHRLCEPVRPTRVARPSPDRRVHTIRVADDDLTVRATLRGALRRETRERRREPCGESTSPRSRYATPSCSSAIVRNRSFSSSAVVAHGSGSIAGGPASTTGTPISAASATTPSRPPRTGRRAVHRHARRRRGAVVPGEDEHERGRWIVAQRLLDLAAQVDSAAPGTPVTEMAASTSSAAASR